MTTKKVTGPPAAVPREPMVRVSVDIYLPKMDPYMIYVEQRMAPEEFKRAKFVTDIPLCHMDNAIQEARFAAAEWIRKNVK